MKLFILSLISLSGMALAQHAPAPQASQVDQTFRDVFMTAGYAAAFGAALGAATLPFQNEPLKNLNYVAGGASIGFVAGTMFGVYNVIQQNQQATMVYPEYGERE